MIQIQVNEKGVFDVRIIAMSAEEERRNFLFWPTIRVYVQKMNDALESEKKATIGGAFMRQQINKLKNLISVLRGNKV